MLLRSGTGKILFILEAIRRDLKVAVHHPSVGGGSEYANGVTARLKIEGA